MKTGTLNEEPTVEKLCHETYITNLFECGLIADKSYPCVGVSPDGIAVLYNEQINNKLACVEIKT